MRRIAQYSITNLDWATVDFYWWMSEGLKDFNFKKPLGILEETYPALALRELSRYTIFDVTNRWQAPDSNFFASVIPRYVISDKKLIKNFNFSKNTDGWKVAGSEDKQTNFSWTDEYSGSLKISKISSGPKIARWESPEIRVEPSSGYLIQALLSTTNELDPDIKEGFIRVDFYNSGKKVQTMLSSRLSKKSEIKEIALNVPSGVDSFRIGFQTYNPNKIDLYLNSVNIFKANVLEQKGSNSYEFNIPEDVIFPNSHGGL